MNATLTFSLPEERQEHLQAIHACALAATLSDLDNWLRNALKYGHQIADADAALQQTRDKIRELLEGNGVPPDVVL